MATDIFDFYDRDLVNLQGWFKKAPKQFARASANVASALAFDSRRKAIKNIEQNVTVRGGSFVGKSLRLTTARPSTNLSSIVAEMGSIDLSGSGRSDGFESLETGKIDNRGSVPTLAARGNKESKKVAGPVRFNKKFFKHTSFRGPGAKTKQRQVALMLRAAREGVIGRKPFEIPNGLTGRLSDMVPGVYKLGNKKQIFLQNPFDGKRKRAKRIAWMKRTIRQTTRDGNIQKIWDKEVDFILRKR